MGMFTALSLGVRLKSDTPGHVIEAIKALLGTKKLDDLYLPEHEFFSKTRAFHLFGSGSYYFDYQTHWSFEYDRILSSYYLSGVSNLKNYDGEIEAFIGWITPYLDTHGFIGWTMEEDNALPTLLIFNGKCITRVNSSNAYDLGYERGRFETTEGLRRRI